MADSAKSLQLPNSTVSGAEEQENESEDFAFYSLTQLFVNSTGPDGQTSWTWDAQDETCGICRMAFDGCCPDCKLPGDDCPFGELATTLSIFTAS
ncbi:hypothetical protein CASFOL_035469 [Castilleja foliolosa]|uniref:Anaphase-promoting complex subunit 11 RING-H2 finger domain-containing protein n=1 Tax=Castilleja foliolosa TaxID=1961234 RepID=A0ABD3BTG0_9LAMI